MLTILKKFFYFLVNLRKPFERIRGEDRLWRIKIYWLRCFTICGIIAFIFYLLVCSFFFFKYKKEIKELSIYNFLIIWHPEKRRSLNHHIGNLYIHDAFKSLRSGKHKNVSQQIINGAQLNPTNIQGAAYVAGFLINQRQVDVALKYLKDKIYQINNIEYLQYFISLCFKYSKEDFLIDTIDECLKKEKFFSAEAINLLRVSEIQAYFHKRKFQKSIYLLDLYFLKETLIGKTIYAEILWEQNKNNEAILILESIPESNTTIQLILASHYRDLKNYTKLLEITKKIENSNADISNRMLLLNIIFDANLPYTETYIENYKKKFVDNSMAMFFLCEFALNKFPPAKTKKIINETLIYAEEKHFENVAQLRLLKYEYQVLYEDPKQVIIDLIKEQKTYWGEFYKMEINAILTLAYFRSNDLQMGNALLDNLLVNPFVPVSILISLGEKFEKINANDTAIYIYERAYIIDDSNNKILLSLIKYALKNQNETILQKYIEDYFNARPSSKAELLALQQYLSSDRSLFLYQQKEFQNKLYKILNDE